MDTDKIIKLYEYGKTSYEIAKELSCSQSFVINTLKKNNITRRTTQYYTTKYKANELFFNSIDSEEKAYTLGFFYADGNNYINGKHSYEISIKLQEKDKIILEKFRDFISPKSEIKIVKDKSTLNKHYRLKVNSKIISDQLTKLGCIPNKSLILTWPNWLIDENLKKHFIRGYFDGDGSLYSKKPTKTGYVNYGWQITSTDNFCNYIKKYLENLLLIHCSQSLSCAKTNQITTTLSVGGNLQVRKVLDWLYKDATIYLPRKHDKYLEFIHLQSLQME